MRSHEGVPSKGLDRLIQFLPRRLILTLAYIEYICSVCDRHLSSGSNVNISGRLHHARRVDFIAQVSHADARDDSNVVRLYAR